MTGNTRDPKQALARLFGDAATVGESAVSPFGDTATGVGPQSRLRSAVTRLRILRSQAGADGLTPSATRSLLDEVVSALEAIEDVLSASATNDPGEEAIHDR
jgi:hypothetical protein